MNIEEAIEILKDNIKSLEGHTPFKHTNYKKIQAIETLLTAYEKEKGENVKLRLQDIPLIAGELKAYKDRVNELKIELEKEKKENESLIKERATEIVYVDRNFVKKDKIKPMQIIDLDGKIHNVYKIEEE